MAKATSKEIEVVEPEVVSQGHSDVPVEPVDFVSRVEYDEAVKSLRNEISDLKTTVADLEAVVTQPSGTVEFYDVIRDSDPPQLAEEPDAVPVYGAGNAPSQSVPWYTTPPLGE